MEENKRFLDYEAWTEKNGHLFKSKEEMISMFIENNPIEKSHPSDSDIEEQAKKNFTVYTGFGKGCSIDMSRIDGFRTGAKWMRDRMNGETEHALNDFLNGLLCRNDIHIKNPVCSNSIAKAVNDYLQKFRNRDL